MIQQCINAHQFLETRSELPEAGQWAELVQGSVVLQQPPDLDHGNVVLNLSKQLATYFSSGGAGYAYFDLGLFLHKAPDTVLFPAVSIFLTGERFAESDKELTSAVPDLVVEIVSTAERRQRAAEKVRQYQAWGVKSVWIVDSRQEAVSRVAPAGEQTWLSARETLQDDLLPGFSVPVHQLFAEPEWYRSGRR